MLLAATWAAPAGAQSTPGTPLTDRESAAIAGDIAALEQDPRGPYSRLRWFCADGSIHPPADSPCRERGGGVQHAEYNERALRLAALGVHVGTIFQGLSYDDLFDAAHDNAWLKELVLNRYLFATDDGWVLRRARYYRGARQMEDEESSGQVILQRLLADTAWTRRNFLLAVRLAGTIPHLTADGTTDPGQIRALASEAAVLDPRFFPVRAKIHSFPGRDDLASVAAYRDSADLDPRVDSLLKQLERALARQYDPAADIDLDRYQVLLPRFASGLAAIRQQRTAHAGYGTLHAVAWLGAAVRNSVAGSTAGDTNVVMLDLLTDLAREAFVIAQDLEPTAGAPVSRARRLDHLADYFTLAYATGFLSRRQLTALDDRLAVLAAAPPTALEYKRALDYLGLSVDWSAATVRGVFGPLWNRYRRFEPGAAGFLDAMVRSGIMLPLSHHLDYLAVDADHQLNATHRIMGRSVGTGLRALNPGLALGPLRVVTGSGGPGDGAIEDPGAIYLLPATTTEMKPAAGVLTRDAGNLLSHVQLLARGLGIPNAAIASRLVPLLERNDSAEVLYAVTRLGRVVIDDLDHLTTGERTLVESHRPGPPARVHLDEFRLRLDLSDPIPLSDLRREMSGAVVGPKAANLGWLAAQFPDHVAPGIALPFGLFYRHANRPFHSRRSVLDELAEAYARADSMRAGGVAEADVDRFMFRRLALVRTAIRQLEWQPDVKAAIVDAIQTTFGERVADGVFVRSDTNMEDLPQFSGAGLNLTVLHRRSVAAILAAIKRVWASPFSERAYLWRKRVLADPARVYPSVLLLGSIPADKSGVLITSGLEHGDSGDLTIATAEGVDGAVVGEDAETVVYRPATGRITLLAQTETPFRRVLVDSGVGGTRLVPATRPEVLLTLAEIQQLQDVVSRWKSRLAAADRSVVWDIEFGFLQDHLWLFQIRPFVQYQDREVIRFLDALDGDIRQRGGRILDLGEQI